jgi:outer membrane protein
MRASPLETRTRRTAVLLFLVAVCSALPRPVTAAPDEDGPPAIGLQEAIETALRAGPELLLAIEDVARARALTREARAGAIPTLAGNATYTRLDAERSVGGNRLAGRDQIFANLLVSAPLLSTQRWVALRHAKNDRTSAELQVQAARREVALAVAHAYLTVIAQHRNIDVQQRALGNARAHYDNAHARYEGGIGNQLDDVRANQEVANSESQLASARAALVSAQEELGLLLGGSGPRDARDIEREPQAAPPEDVAQAAEGRADVRASQQLVKSAHSVVHDSWADYMPILTGVFQPFFQDPPTVQYPRTGWQAQLILSVPLFDGTLRNAQYAERKSALSRSRIELDALLRRARSEIRVAADAVQRADESLEAAQRAAELARQALSMANAAYVAGATSDIEVVDAERRARDAETAAVVAEDTARRARLDLLSASGRLP